MVQPENSTGSVPKRFEHVPTGNKQDGGAHHGDGGDGNRSNTRRSCSTGQEAEQLGGIMIRKLLGKSARRIGFVLIAYTGSAVMATSSATAGSCTDGVNCYCDTVSDPNLIYCADWESLDYYANTANDWAATTAGSGNRGNLSRYNLDHGGNNGGGTTLYRRSDPTPKMDQACTAGAECVGSREYCSEAQGDIVVGGNSANANSDCWGPGANTLATIDIQRSGDFDAEITDLTLTGGSGVTPDIGAGNQSFAWRVPVGHETLGGMIKSFPTASEIGVTQAMAFASNLVESTVISDQWKFDEYFNGASAGYPQFWTHGRSGSNGDNAYFPYGPFLSVDSGGACDAALAAATVQYGTAACYGGSLLYYSPKVFSFPYASSSKSGADSGYRQSTHFRFGEWHCSQAHISGMGTTNMKLELKHDGKTVFSMTGFDGTALVAHNFTAFMFDAYANRNATVNNPRTSTTETTYRYHDNMHIRNGPPVSCSAIGFDGLGGSAPPPAPTSLPAPVLLP